MVNQKFIPFWPLTIAICFLTLLYSMASLTLLRSHQNNIDFTQTELHGLEDYQSLMRAYWALHQSPAPLSNEAQTSAKSIRRQLREVGDRSKLILDPETTSYYAVDILFNRLPSLIAAAHNAPALLPTWPTEMTESLHHAANIFKKDPSPSTLASRQKIRHLITSLTHATLPSSTNQSAALRTLDRQTTDLLTTVLKNRLHDQKRTLTHAKLIILALYGALIGLLIFAMRNYVSRRELRLTQERQTLMHALEAKNDELEKFAYAAAHDLKGPIRTMRCFSGLLTEEYRAITPPLPSSMHTYINIIDNTAQRAEEMIHDLLRHTQVSEEKLAFESCDCGRELDAVLADMHPIIAHAHPEWIRSPLPTLLTVPSMFRRVLLNLLDNAIKYRREDVPLCIAIQATKEKTAWLFSVEDNGIGITEEHRTTVFEPFRRLENTSSSEGSGIGLTSCKKVVERLGGKIWIEPLVPHGTRVCFTLPTTPPSPHAGSPR